MAGSEGSYSLRRRAVARCKTKAGRNTRTDPGLLGGYGERNKRIRQEPPGVHCDFGTDDLSVGGRKKIDHCSGKVRPSSPINACSVFGLGKLWRWLLNPAAIL